MSEEQTRKPAEGALGRRDLLGLGAATLAAGTLAAPAVVRAQDKFNWKMVSAWPKNSPGVGVNAQRLADSITAMSGGRLTVQLFAAGELVPPFECFDAVSSGAAEMAHGSPYFWQGKDKAFHFFTGMPFGLFANEHMGWIWFGGGQALWEKAYAPFGIQPFYCGSSGPQAGGWFRKEINTVDDFKGLKMRIAGLGGEVLRRLRVNVVLLPPGEIFQAMQSGTIDAAEWVGPWNDLAFGLFRVAKNYYLPSFFEFGPALELMVNKKLYDTLPADLKDIVKRAAYASAAESYADFAYHNVVSLKPLLDKEGVQVRTLSEDIVKVLAKETKAAIAEIAASGAMAKEVFESYEAYRQQCMSYAKVMDMAAYQMREVGRDLS
ncbi:TRAP transporter substrate-binding protein [Pinisolibacter aquiterrae]|uniref:TRAP transporter substrate-binding protein n=1 Tax=Pinisolibacter aquiterrae TaxID=2815579 RepID=UPI001E4564C6|nr:TRAP transporter substrate-binding protein [Pinisolibacter aquiterrae]MCC8236870.1 TRAP transporter substrate-binding protein [Pinisolibacter aquiterrae]